MNRETSPLDHHARVVGEYEQEISKLRAAADRALAEKDARIAELEALNERLLADAKRLTAELTVVVEERDHYEHQRDAARQNFDEDVARLRGCLIDRQALCDRLVAELDSMERNRNRLSASLTDASHSWVAAEKRIAELEAARQPAPLPEGWHQTSDGVVHGPENGERAYCRDGRVFIHTKNSCASAPASVCALLSLPAPSAPTRDKGDELARRAKVHARNAQALLSEGCICGDYAAITGLLHPDCPKHRAHDEVGDRIRNAKLDPEVP